MGGDKRAGGYYEIEPALEDRTTERRCVMTDVLEVIAALNAKDMRELRRKVLWEIFTTEIEEIEVDNRLSVVLAMALDSHPDKPEDQAIDDETGYTPWTSDALDKVELKATNRAITAIVEFLAAANLTIEPGWQLMDDKAKDGDLFIDKSGAIFQASDCRLPHCCGWAIHRKSNDGPHCHIYPTHYKPITAPGAK